MEETHFRYVYQNRTVMMNVTRREMVTKSEALSEMTTVTWVAPEDVTRLEEVTVTDAIRVKRN